MQQIVLFLDKQTKIKEPIVACIGYFDGFHKGHLALVEQVKKIAEKKQCKTGIITFHPDPWVVLKNETNVKHLTTLSDRSILATKLNVDFWIIINFTKELAQLSPQQFIEDFLSQINLNTLVAGFDFRFGFKGAGGVEQLKSLGNKYFDTVVIDKVEDLDSKVSSTRISSAILAGNVDEAARLLTRPYKISGMVVHGQKQGRKIGFPTANVDVLDEYIIPKIGVYIGGVSFDGKDYQAMINIGHNPTFNTRSEVSIEAYILDFDENIYGKSIDVLFYQRIRDELKFDGVQALIEQMNLDYLTTRKYFASNKNFKKVA